MEISLLHPSRGRAKKSRETIDFWRMRAGLSEAGIEILIGVEAEEAEEYYSEYFPCGDRVHHSIKIISNEYGTAVKAINDLANISVGRIMIVVSDDSSCPPSWANKILRYTQGKSDFVLRVKDGIQPKMITMPILDRVYYQRDGYIYHPAFRHAWADRYFTEVAYKRKRVIEKNIMFRHLHYSVSKTKFRDEQYARTDATFNEGKRIYNELIKKV